MLTNILYIAFASAGAILIKLIDRNGYSHPFAQVFYMFLGEFLCVLTIRKFNFYHMVLAIAPCLLDIITSSLLFYSFNHIDLSVIQVVRTLNILIIYMFSVIFRRDFENNIFKAIGIVLILVGIIVASQLQDPSRDDYWYIAMLMLSQFTFSFQSLVEEYILKTYKDVPETNIPERGLRPQELIGYEGLCGTAIMSITLMFLEDRSIVEDFEKNYIWLMLLLYISMTPVVNFMSVYIITEWSASYRSVLESTRIVVVFVLSCLLKWESPTPYKIIGYIMLIIGFLLYNFTWAHIEQWQLEYVKRRAIHELESRTRTINNLRRREHEFNQEPLLQNTSEIV
jgi:drug/metabolite transporter (DMT)-like permease